MSRINLAIPFNKKDEIKKNYKIKWDKDERTWYYEDDKLPKELQKYIETIIKITYDEREKLKSKCPSARFSGSRKTWVVSKEDYDFYINIE